MKKKLIYRDLDEGNNLGRHWVEFQGENGSKSGEKLEKKPLK